VRFTFRYLSHPQVNIDPATPVPLWGLSAIGHARCQDAAAAGVLCGTQMIVTSAETKALETALHFERALRVKAAVREGTHENDRTSTGFLEGPEFEHAADQFFAYPERSYRGWERAVDAQVRIVSEVRSILSSWSGGDILMIGHGGVGTLLYCHFAQLPIKRNSDQPAGGGNFWAMEFPETLVLHGWLAMETL
jgi:broad specificity phosphatase PhoE